MIHRILPLAALFLLLPHGGRAADVVLKTDAKPSTSVVRLGDVAIVSCADKALADALAQTALMPAPAVGGRQFLSAAQLRDILLANGFEAHDLNIVGSGSVMITTPAAPPAAPRTPSTTPSNSPAPQVSPEDQKAADDQIAALLTRYLREQSGCELWDVKVGGDSDAIDLSQTNVARLKVQGGKAPWTGRQQFTISRPGVKQDAIVSALVQRIDMAVVAVRAIERGDLVRSADVELRPQTGGVPQQAISALDACVGKEALQAIRPGAVLVTSQLRAPIVVHRGERVSVRARAAGIVVRTYATAQQDGGLGDLVMIQPLEGKERYAARVSGVRELEVFAAGAAALEVAAHAH